jgi:hypothetical protein
VSDVRRRFRDRSVVRPVFPGTDSAGDTGCAPIIRRCPGFSRRKLRGERLQGSVDRYLLNHSARGFSPPLPQIASADQRLCRVHGKECQTAQFDATQFLKDWQGQSLAPVQTSTKTSKQRPRGGDSEQSGHFRVWNCFRIQIRPDGPYSTGDVLPPMPVVSLYRALR